MKYYNQNDYGNVPYPSKTNPKATVKSGGCGVCCASMIVENLTSHKFPVATAASYSISIGARASTGTNMGLLAKSIAAKFGLNYSTTSSEPDLLTHLKNGGMAIANVGGDRSGWQGVFSDGGHYIIVAGYNPGSGRVNVLDPGYYDGKYTKYSWRKKYVTVNGRGNLSCEASILDKDCANRSPRYYLFGKKQAPNNQGGGNMSGSDNQAVSSWAKEAWEWAKKAGLMDGTNPKDPVTREQLAAILQKFVTKYIEK